MIPRPRIRHLWRTCYLLLIVALGMLASDIIRVVTYGAIYVVHSQFLAFVAGMIVGSSGVVLVIYRVFGFNALER